jgi:hypothetical protein
MKKSFVGMAVLLSVALVFSGCLDELEDILLPEGPVPGDPEALTVGGFEIEWQATTENNDGSEFSKPIIAEINIFPGQTGSGFTAPSGVAAVLSEGQLSEEEFLVKYALGEKVSEQIAKLSVSDDPYQNRRYLYLHGTDWRRVDVTLLPIAAAKPSNTAVQIVEYKSGTSGDSFARLAFGGVDAWYNLTPSTLETVIRAIYEPNKPDTTDTMESGKTAVSYTPALSAEVLKLFWIKIGAAGAVNSIEIRDTALPAAGVHGASAIKPIVIDVGLPGSADNSSLPTFYIPNQGLGSGAGNYAHIRLRVNEGASLVILADNSGYIANGAGNSCPNGLFNGGCVEVMAGGKLRDGAYEGFPLGANAVILNRYGSYLSVGPHPDDNDAKGNMAETYNAYYSGYLIGPANASVEDDKPRIEWDTGTNASRFLEVRPDKIATDAKLTVKKMVGLIYSVWFVDDAAVTVADGAVLVTNESADSQDKDFNFYANTAGAVVTIEATGTFDRRFLKKGAADAADSDFITASGESITISGTTTGTPVPYAAGTTITGFLVPDPVPADNG